MLKSQENKLGIGNSKLQGMKFSQKKVKSKDLGNISLDLSKEEEVMRKTPGLMENSMIENITTMNSIFAQKQSERLMLNNNFNQLNNLKINESQNNTINNSNQTFNALVDQNISNSNMSGENPLDMAVIIKDSSEVKEEEEKEKEKEKKKKRTKKRNRKKKKKSFNKTTILIIFLLIIIAVLIIGLIMTYVSVAKD